MSMLSAQCDELRKMADQLQKRGTFNPLMRGAATAMREAADTIWHLRNQLNDLQAENAKTLMDMADTEGYDQMLRDRLRQETELRVKAETENTRLKELVRDMWNGMCARPECSHCEHYELKDGQRFVGECEFHRRMREFGIEAE